MEYSVMSRIIAREATYSLLAKTTAIISIVDIGAERNKFYPQPWLKHILELQFDDVEKGQKGCITKKQAKTIAEFVCEIYRQVERIIVHCEFGQSRSAGVAAAISRHFEGHSSGIFGNRVYYPNKTCYKYVLAALKKINKETVKSVPLTNSASMK